MNPNTRALGATILFSVAALWALLFHAVPFEFVWPHALFYATLTINTYFSVRFYSAFTPETTFQYLIDGALTLAYIALALSIGLPVPFALCALLVFAIAPAKYAQMLGATAYDKTLRKKILIDLLGTSMCVAVLGITLLGYESQGAWLLAGLFAAANVYLLLIKPMYRHVL